jgi:drug/metabolite transporter (DMT)-like permease
MRQHIGLRLELTYVKNGRLYATWGTRIADLMRNNLSPKTEGLVAINLAAVIFGSAALYGKLEVSPVWITFTRAGFGALTLLILALPKGGVAAPPRDLWQTIAGSGALLAAHWLSFFASVQLAGIAVATLTFASFPMFTVLIEAVHQKRRPQIAELGAALAVIFAVSLLADARQEQGSVLGAAAGLISGITYACFWHTGKRLRRRLPPLTVSLHQSAVTATLLLPVLPFASPAPGQLSDWLWLALLGIVNTAIMLQLYLYALERISASTCSGFVALEPVYAILLAALLFHEPITAIVGLSAALIVGASFILHSVEASP